MLIIKDHIPWNKEVESYIDDLLNNNVKFYLTFAIEIRDFDFLFLKYFMILENVISEIYFKIGFSDSLKKANSVKITTKLDQLRHVLKYKDDDSNTKLLNNIEISFRLNDFRKNLAHNFDYNLDKDSSFITFLNKHVENNEAFNNSDLSKLDKNRKDLFILFSKVMINMLTVLIYINFNNLEFKSNITKYYKI